MSCTTLGGTPASMTTDFDNGSQKSRTYQVRKIANVATQATLSLKTLEDLLTETREYLTLQDMEKIKRAYELASEAHKGVVRRSGEPYIQHPLEVALLLADMRIDADGIIAALLHDVVEDTTYSLEELRKQFGAAVASIVDGVTKFDALVPGGAATAPSANAEIKVVQDTSVEDVANSQNTVVKQAQDDEQGPQQIRDFKRHQRSETVRKMLLAMAEDPRVVVLK